MKNSRRYKFCTSILSNVLLNLLNKRTKSWMDGLESVSSRYIVLNMTDRSFSHRSSVVWRPLVVRIRIHQLTEEQMTVVTQED